MSEVTIGTASVDGSPQPAAGAVPVEETFSYPLADGTTIVVGKPIGVLKLRLRKLLDDWIDDKEMVGIATAFLSIRRFEGVASPLLNKVQFEGMLSRFKSDEDLDRFMNKFGALMNPELSDMIKTALSEGLDKGLMGSDLEEYVQRAAMPLAAKELAKLRD